MPRNDSAADDHRPPPKCRVVALLHRCVERVEVGVQDRRFACHEHMFVDEAILGNEEGDRRERTQ
jgi:hypothetical protein